MSYACYRGCDCESCLKQKIRNLRKQLKEAKASIPKPVDKARVATAVVAGLNYEEWDKASCCGANKDVWLTRLFSYLGKQGVVLK